jgi:HK97 family phage portal protein
MSRKHKKTITLNKSDYKSDISINKTETGVVLTTIDQFLGKYLRNDCGATGQLPSSFQQELSYLCHPIVRSCIDYIAGRIPSARLEVGTYEGRDFKAKNFHPLLELLKHPNPDQTFYDFIFDLVVKMYSGGCGYIWKKMNVAETKVLEMRVIPASWITPIYTTDNKTIDYYMVQSQDYRVPKKEMIVLSFGSSTDLVSSVGPIASCWAEISSDLERSTYFKELLLNFKIPTVVVQTKVKNASDRKAMDDFWENKLGKNKRGGMVTIGEGESVSVINQLQEVDWPGFTSQVESRICSALGVPGLLVGTRQGMERSTFSNAKEITQNFFDTTLRNLWVQIANSLTKGLINQESNLEFKFSFEELPEFQEDQTIKVQRITMMMQAGIINLNEARKMMGLPDLAELYNEPEKKIEEAPVPQIENKVIEEKPIEENNNGVQQTEV